LAEHGYGDCEDYQLLKRRKLVEAGYPHRALRMTVVIDEEGAGHAVMMVRTNRGDFILDNKRNAILPWHKTGLHLHQARRRRRFRLGLARRPGLADHDGQPVTTTGASPFKR
jgi:predicted transglutaminase-like cysteine proteinase